MTDLLQVFLLAMTPLGELRLAIPMGVAVYHLSPVLVFFVAVIGNLIPAILLLLFLKRVSAYLSGKSVVFKKVFTWWEDSARKKHIAKIQEYDAIGLAIFTAVPLPLTGAWTGALLATMMNMSLKKSIPAVVAGVAVAGLLVTAFVVLGVNIEKYFGWQLLVEILVAVAIIFIIRKLLTSKNR